MRTQKPKSRGTAARPVKSRRTSFSQLERSKQQWVQDIDAISDFIVVHDRDWKIVRTNRSLADHLGLPPVALVGEAVSSLRQLAEGDGTLPCPFCLYTGLSKEEHIISSADKIYLVSTSRTSGARFTGKNQSVPRADAGCDRTEDVSGATAARARLQSKNSERYAKHDSGAGYRRAGQLCQPALLRGRLSARGDDRAAVSGPGG